MAKADPLGSKPSGVWSDRRTGWLKGSSASWGRVVAELDQGALGRGAGEGAGRGAVRFKYQLLHRQSTFEEAGLPSGLVKPSVGVGDSLNLALVLS